MIAHRMTAEEFAERKYDLPDEGRWQELHKGELATFNPPTPDHGTFVLNLSRVLGQWLERHRTGFVCFDLGLVVEREPDTVLCPAISYFLEGNGWAEMDKTVTSTRPSMVIEVTSTPDRRRSLSRRVALYQSAGCGLVWNIEPHSRRVAIHGSNAQLDLFEPGDVIRSQPTWTDRVTGAILLDDFEISVDTIFHLPDWWTGAGAKAEGE